MLELAQKQTPTTALLVEGMLCVGCVERDRAEENSRSVAQSLHLEGQARFVFFCVRFVFFFGNRQFINN